MADIFFKNTNSWYQFKIPERLFDKITHNNGFIRNWQLATGMIVLSIWHCAFNFLLKESG